jgi:hypothetical protein
MMAPEPGPVRVYLDKARGRLRINDSSQQQNNADF